MTLTFLRPHCLFGVALGWLLAMAPLRSSADDVQDFLFLGGPPPVLIRIHVRVGDRPREMALQDAIAKIHAHLDTDTDGRLTRAEFDRVEWPRFFQALRNGIRTSDSLDLHLLAAREPADVISIENFAAFFRAHLRPRSTESRPQRPLDQDTTFARLDVDGDGTLARDELAHCLDALRVLDQNDDEMISLAEQAPFRSPLTAAPLLINRTAAAAPLMMLLDPKMPRTQLRPWIMNRFDSVGANGSKSKDGLLSSAEIRLPAEVFAAYDGNDDEMLDAAELGAYVEGLEPSVELIVRLGPIDPGHFRVEVGNGTGEDRQNVPRVRVRRVDSALATLDLGDCWIELRIQDTAEVRARQRQLNRTQFMSLSKSTGNTVGASDVQGREPFQSLFPLMDRDTNGKVTEDELNAALDVLDALSSNQAVFRVEDRGEMLFGILDADSDGRLGLRELLAAQTRIASYDRDGDGRINRSEIPHRYDWVISTAPTTIGSAVAIATNIPLATPARPGEGPAWFAKMDRNRDGDLSPREFLGPREVFHRLDVDRNGLIDAREAK